VTYADEVPPSVPVEISAEEAWEHEFRVNHAVSIAGAAMPLAGGGLLAWSLLREPDFDCTFCRVFPNVMAVGIASLGVPVEAVGGLRACHALGMLGEHRKCTGAKLALASVPVAGLGALAWAVTFTPVLGSTILLLPIGWICGIVQVISDEVAWERGGVDLVVVPTIDRRGTVGLAVGAAF
jgi:hypothetical protein